MTYKLFPLLLFVLFLCFSISAQQTADSLGIRTLEEVTVQGFADKGSSADVAGSIGVLNTEALQAANPSSPAFAFNTLSGVRLEQRAEGSYRFSIRGSSLRSPFGVRNVKFYWNGIPITEASGRTHLNLLDMSSYAQAEVIKGPAGSLYGAGAGGAVQLNTFSAPQQATLQATYLLGSDNYQQRQLSYQQYSNEKGWKVLYSRRKSDGYREQNFLDRNFFQLSNKGEINSSTKVAFHSLYSDLGYGVPGGLNREQYLENPQQARSGSVEKKVAVYHSMLLAGATLTKDFNDHWSNETTVYAWFGDFEMPFNFNYETQEQLERGGRSTFQWENNINDNLQVKATFGGEWQRGDKEGFNYGNTAGNPDTLRFADNLQTDQWFLFAQVQALFNSGLKLEAGLSYNRTQIDLHRISDQQQDTTFRKDLAFDPVLVPRLAISYPISPSLKTYFSYSLGYSVPTLDEIRTDDLFINEDLQPEKLHNLELGFKFRRERLQADLTLFRGQLFEAITSFSQANSPYNRFQNAGEVQQLGLEAQVSWEIIRQTKAIEAWTVSTAITAYRFQFEEYATGDDNLSGKDVPGVPNVYQTVSTELQLKSGLYAGIQGFYSSDLPVDNLNTETADAYFFANANIGYQIKLSPMVLDLNLRVYNLSDTKFSLGNDINAFGNRYFQPAPARRIYAGATLRWLVGS